MYGADVAPKDSLSGTKICSKFKGIHMNVRVQSKSLVHSDEPAHIHSFIKCRELTLLYYYPSVGGYKM